MPPASRQTETRDSSLHVGSSVQAALTQKTCCYVAVLLRNDTSFVWSLQLCGRPANEVRCPSREGTTLPTISRRHTSIPQDRARKRQSFTTGVTAPPSSWARI